MAIVSIVPTPQIDDASNNPLNSPIQFAYPGLFFGFKRSGNSPEPHITHIRMPRYNELAEYSNYANWKVLVPTEANGPMYWAYASPNNFNSLGSPIVDDDGSLKNELELEFNFTNLYNFNPGTYYAYARIKILADNTQTGQNGVLIAERIYPIAVNLAATVPQFFYVTYFKKNLGRLEFTYTIGSTGFKSQRIFVYTNIDYDVSLNDESGLLTYSKGYYSQFQVLEIGYKAPNIEPIDGVINSEITLIPIGDGGSAITIPLKIFVHEPTVLDLSVSPDDIVFNSVIGVPPYPVAKEINVLSKSAWTIPAQLKPFWLQTAPTNGPGDGTLMLSVANQFLVSSGRRTFQLKITNATAVAYVNVVYNLFDYMSSPFTAGRVSFTRDLDYIVFHSPFNNTYISLSARIKIYSPKTYEAHEYVRNYNLPLFQGTCDFHLGTVVEQLFEELTQLGDALGQFGSDGYATQYRPADIYITYREIDFATQEVKKSGRINNILMVKGNNPTKPIKAISSSRYELAVPIDLNFNGPVRSTITENAELILLDTMQEDLSRVTPNSVLGVNFCHTGTPKMSIKKNGVTVKQLDVTPVTGKVLYNYLNFSVEKEVGDVIEFVVKNGLKSRSRKFVVFPEGKETTHIFFENSWGMVETFEFTGRRKLTSQYEHTTANKFKDLYEYSKKVKSVNNQKVTVNTGFMLPADHKVIDGVIKSKNVWCSFDNEHGPYYTIDATTTKITNIDTDMDAGVAFEIEFNLTDNADVTIFVQ